MPLNGETISIKNPFHQSPYLLHQNPYHLRNLHRRNHLHSPRHNLHMFLLPHHHSIPRPLLPLHSILDHQILADPKKTSVVISGFSRIF